MQHLRLLLRASRERPCRSRAADERDELASPHSPPRRFADRYGNVRLHQSALAPENLITLAHFSVSLDMNLAKSEDKPRNTAAPRSANRAFNLGSTRPALISLLSLSTISAGLSLGAAMP